MRRHVRRRTNLLAVLLAVSLTAAACGSRVVPLTDGGQNGLPAAPGTAHGDLPGAQPEDGAAPLPPGEAPPPGVRESGAARPSGCAGGGATDSGVSAAEIKLGLVASITGSLPGQFNSAVEAVDTYFKMVNSEQGGICGRRVRLIIRDDGGLGPQNEKVARELAEEEKVFAFVGGIAAPDDTGIGKVSRKHRIPDIGFPLTYTRTESPYTYGVPGQLQKNQIGVGASGSRYLNRVHNIKQVAILWLDESDVSRLNAWAFEAAMQKATGGALRICFEQATTVFDNNFTQYAVKMKGSCRPENGPVAVYTTMENNSNIKLAKAMRDQDFTPAFYAPTLTSYLPSFISQASGATEGAYVALPQIPFERCGRDRSRPAPPCSHPELHRYVAALHRYTPGFSEPGSFGGAGWGIARLFHEAALGCGATLTRTCLLRQLEEMGPFSADGLLSPTRPGDHVIFSADLILQVRNGTFVEIRPGDKGGPPGGEDFWNDSEIFDWWKFYCANKGLFPNTAEKDRYIEC